MSVAQICAELGWTTTDLAREAGINWRTAKNAMDGIEPAPRTKKDICKAFSRALKEDISPAKIAWEI